MKEITEKILCDCCGEVITQPTIASDEMSHALISLKYDIYYGGCFQITDICKFCNIKLFKFLSENKMLLRASRK